MVEPVRHRRTKGAETDMFEPKATASHLERSESFRAPNCGKPMRLARTEPAAPGYDVRIFECPECNTTGSFSVAI